MVVRQVVNLRTRIPFRFSTREAEREYELEVAAARRAQAVPYAVAPRATLKLPNGAQKLAGEAVFLSDFEGCTVMTSEVAGVTVTTSKPGRANQMLVPARKALADAVFEGLVIEGYNVPPTAA